MCATWRASATATLVGVVVLACSWPARAHHPGPNPTPTLPRSRIALDTAATEFVVQGGGYARLAALTLEHALFERMSLGARLPVAAASFADGHEAFGPSDIDITLRVMAFQSYHEDFALIGGLGLELPTGRVEDGLGGGHFMLTPMISASYRMHRSFMLSLIATDHLPLDDEQEAPDTVVGTSAATPQHTGHEPPGPSRTVPAETEPEVDAEPHGSVLAPHTNHEMRLKVVPTYLWAPFYLSLAGEVVVMFEATDPFGPFTVEPELGVRPDDAWRIATTLTLPVAGQRRMRWHARLTVEYSF